MVSLSGFKAHGVFDADATDSELELTLRSAMKYFENSGVQMPLEDNPLYDMGVYQLATFYFERLNTAGMSAAAKEIPYGINGIILQLRNG